MFGDSERNVNTSALTREVKIEFQPSGPDASKETTIASVLKEFKTFPDFASQRR